MSCDANALLSSASCFECLPKTVLIAIRVRLLCAILDGETMSCDPATLVSQAVAFMPLNLSSTQLESIETYLLCQLASGGIGGGSGQIVAYTSGTPANPADVTQPALAYDPDGNLPTLGWNTNTQTWA